jgi:hypothetical protein
MRDEITPPPARPGTGLPVIVAADAVEDDVELGHGHAGQEARVRVVQHLRARE